MAITQEQLLQKALSKGRGDKTTRGKLHRAGFKYRGNGIYLREGGKNTPGFGKMINAYGSINNPKVSQAWETYNQNGITGVDTYHSHNEGMTKQQRRKDALKQIKGGK